MSDKNLGTFRLKIVDGKNSPLMNVLVEIFTHSHSLETCATDYGAAFFVEGSRTHRGIFYRNQPLANQPCYFVSLMEAGFEDIDPTEDTQFADLWSFRPLEDIETSLPWNWNTSEIP